MLANRIVSEPEGIESVPSIRGTLKIHKFVRMFNNGHPYIFELVCDDESCCVTNMLQTQERFVMVIRKPEHTVNIAGFAKIVTKSVIDWLQCSVCSLWFHEKRFY